MLLYVCQEPANQYFFDLSKKPGGGFRGHGRKRHSDGDGRGRDQQHHQGQPKQPRRHRESSHTLFISGLRKNSLVWFCEVTQIICFSVCSSALGSMLVLSGQPSGGEAPRHQHRNTREFMLFINLHHRSSFETSRKSVRAE